MSATIDAMLFAKYFATPVARQMQPAPIVRVQETKRPYKIEEYYLDDLTALRKDGQVRKSGALPSLKLFLHEGARG